MGKWCDGCGAWLDFRTIDGQRRPISPCACGPGGASLTISSDRDGDPRFVGSRVLSWPATYQTTCWWCGEPVLYHTNGYGDCVLFDLPLIPWEVHSCWSEHVGQRSRAAFSAGVTLASRGFSDQELSEHQNEQAAEEVDRDAWHPIAAISIDDELAVRHSEGWDRFAGRGPVLDRQILTVVGVVDEIDGLTVGGLKVRLRLTSGMVVVLKRHLANRYHVGSIVVAQAIATFVAGEWTYEVVALHESNS